MVTLIQFFEKFKVLFANWFLQKADTVIQFFNNDAISSFQEKSSSNVRKSPQRQAEGSNLISHMVLFCLSTQALTVISSFSLIDHSNAYSFCFSEEQATVRVEFINVSFSLSL